MALSTRYCLLAVGILMVLSQGALAQTCNGNGVYTSGADRPCVCSAGYAGNDCGQCQGDATCAAKTPGAFCSNSYLFGAGETKYFSCVAGGVAASLLAPNTLAANCNTTGTATCGLSFVLAGDPVVAVQCVASPCTIPIGTGTASCKALICQCPGAAGCAGPFGDIIKGLRGAVDLSCDAAGACSINISDSPVSLTATCTAATCSSRGGALGAAATTSGVAPAPGPGYVPPTSGTTAVAAATAPRAAGATGRRLKA